MTMTAKKPFLSVYGHITIDQIVSVERFPNLNETVDIFSKTTTLGGTGANIAIAAAKLGVPTAICAFVGSDIPMKYVKEIEDSGLITDELVTVNDFETSQCTVLNDAELRQKVIFYQGPQGYASQIGKDLLKNARESEWVHFCTGEPDYYLRLMSELSGNSARVSLDPAQETYRLWPEERLSRGIPMADAVFCNEYEAKVIEERMGIGSVLDLDKSLVVKTLGAAGSIARIGDEIVEIPCVQCVKAVDATGCGDTFRAGFYSGLYHGYSVKESLILASAVSSFTIERTGALNNLPEWSAVEERAAPYLR